MHYFISDTHLRSGGSKDDRRTEELVIAWLKSVSLDADTIFLCGDIFDFWFEYQYVVPKGFIRLFAELRRLTDSGVRVVFMAGNHDMWVGTYLHDECGVEIYTKPEVFDLGGIKVHVAHGDNLNVVNDWKLKILNSIFRSTTVRLIFSRLVHPDIALRFGFWWSDTSRKNHKNVTESSYAQRRAEVDALIEYAAKQQEIAPADHYLYGHLHQSLQHRAVGSTQKEYTITFIRDWSNNPTYAKLDTEGNMTIENVII